MQSYDVVALGELLIDFTENGMSSRKNPVLEANPGGAPCNVLSMLTRLGHRTGFIGKVGDDLFGRQLEAAIREAGISAEGLVKDPTVRTTLAFVHTQPDGDRDFSFYRNPGADMMLTADEVSRELIRNTRIFHYGSLSMTDGGCFHATAMAIETAKAAGALCSFDPNLREPLWGSLAEAREKIAWGISQCELLKISDNEIAWFTGEPDYDAAVRMLRQQYPNLKLILVTLGRDGSLGYSGSSRVFVPAFLQEGTVETTGAGDTFCGCVLHYVLAHGYHDYSAAELQEMLTFANAAASIVTTRRGALRVMPTLQEVEALAAQAEEV